MGTSSQKGVFGIAPQAAMGSPVTATASFKYMRMLSVPQLGERGTMQLPPEIGGVRGSQGSIVNSVSVGSEISMLGRSTFIGYLLKSLTGSVGAATDTGVITHTFAPAETAVWLSCLRRVGDGTSTDTSIGERFEDCQAGSMTLDFVPGQPLTVSVALLGRKSVAISAPTDAALTGLWDTSPVLTCVGANAAAVLQDEANAAISVAVTRARVTIDNALTPDGLELGSLYIPDMTKRGLNVAVSMDVVMRSAALYRKVYTAAALTGEFSTTISVGQISLKAASAENIAGTSTPNSLEFKNIADGDNVEFLSFPLNLRGNDTVTGTLAANVKLSTGNSVFQLLLKNGFAGY